MRSAFNICERLEANSWSLFVLFAVLAQVAGESREIKFPRDRELI
jgi:hypothetical protein